MLPKMQTHVRPRVMWIPLLLLGSLIYWSLAMGLGMTSLSLLGGSCEQETLALQPGERIPVEYLGHEPGPWKPGNDPEPLGAGGSQATNDGTGRLPAADHECQSGQPSSEDLVGRTAY
jgi:hypothetical protein